MSELNNNILGNNIETKAIDNDIILGATSCGTYDLMEWDLFYIHVLKLSVNSETISGKTYNIKSIVENNGANANKIYANNDTTQTLNNIGNYYYYYAKNSDGTPLVKGINSSILGANIPSPTNITLNIPGHYANSFTQNWYTISGTSGFSVIDKLSNLSGLSISISNVTANINRYTLTNGKKVGEVSPLLIWISTPPDYDDVGDFYYYSYTNDGNTYYPVQQIKLKYPYDRIGFQIFSMFGSSCKINNSQAAYINLSGFSNNSVINLDNYISSITYDDKIQTVNIFEGKFPFSTSKIVKNTDSNCCLAGNISINNFFGLYTTVTNQNKLLKAIDLKGIKGTENAEKLGIEYNQERDIIITPHITYIEPTNEPPKILVIYNLSPKYNLYVINEADGTQVCKINKSTSSTMSSASINLQNVGGLYFLYNENSSISSSYKYKSYSSVVSVDYNSVTYDTNNGYYVSDTFKECLVNPQYDVRNANVWAYPPYVLYDECNGVLYCHNYTNTMYCDVDFELWDDFSDYPLEITLYYQGNEVETITLTESGEYDCLYMEYDYNFYDYEVYFNQDVQLVDDYGEILTADREYIYSGYYYVSDIRPSPHWYLNNNHIYIKKA